MRYARTIKETQANPAFLILLVLLVNDSEYSQSAGAKPIFKSLLAAFISFPWRAVRPYPTPPPPFGGEGKYQKEKSLEASGVGAWTWLCRRGRGGRGRGRSVLVAMSEWVM